MQLLTKLEHGRQKEQARLDNLKTATERNHLGQFATPMSLALEVAKLALIHWGKRSEVIRFLDPALGTGAFYSALLHIYPVSNLDSAVGIELDPAFAQVANNLWQPLGLEVIAADFTSLQPPSEQTKANLIICNPPYIRHHHLGTTQKHRLHQVAYEATNISLNGLAGMYCYFMLAAHQWLGANGLSVWLIPAEFMDVNYGEAIRSYLTKQVTLKQIHRFEAVDTQFPDALVSSAIVVFEQATPSPENQVVFTLGGRPTKPKSSFTITTGELSKSRKWSQEPRQITQISPKTQQEISFGDLFKTRRGIATGANSFFILAREEARKLGLPEDYLRPILPSPRYLDSPIVAADTDGFPLVTPQLVLLDCDLPEAQIKLEYPSLWDYLEYGKSRGYHRRYLTRNRAPWYRQERRSPSPFLCTYMGRSQKAREPFKFLWNQSVATAPNVYLLLYPRKHLAAFLRGNPVRQGDVFQLLSEIAMSALIREGRTYGGGLHKIEPRELLQVSISNIPLAQELTMATLLS